MAHKTVVGKKLIEMLMFNLYSDNRVVYREYIQNASDAIHKAIEAGVIGEGEGHITVNIDKFKRRVEIKDNGIGIKSSEVERILKDIANSGKSSDESQAGYFGIGRLSGGGYCKKMTFKTSYKGEKTSSILVFDVEGIRAVINDVNDNSTAEEIIDGFTKFADNFPADEDEHFFSVILEDVLPEYSIILNEEKIVDYLREVAPLPFKPSFKKNLLDDCISNFENMSVESYYKRIGIIQITVNKHNDIRKAYDLKVGKDDIEKIRFFLVKDDAKDGFGDLAWGWYAVTPFTEQISSNEYLTIGIRLRLHNIMVGNRDYFDGRRFFKEERSNKYFVGEVHIINTNIKPTPQRDDLAPSPETNMLNEKIRDLFTKELSVIYNYANTLKVALKNFEKSEKTSEDYVAVKSDFSKKCNNVYKNLIGYQYLLDIYRPQFEALFEKYKYLEPQEGQSPNSGVKSSEDQSNSDVQLSNENTVPNAFAESSSIFGAEDIQSSNSSSGSNAQSNVSQNDSDNSDSETDSPNEPNQDDGDTQTNEKEDKLKKLLDKLPKDEALLLQRVIDIIDIKFSGEKRKLPVNKTAKNIEYMILKELSKKTR